MKVNIYRTTDLAGEPVLINANLISHVLPNGKCSQVFMIGDAAPIRIQDSLEFIEATLNNDKEGN